MDSFDDHGNTFALDARLRAKAPEPSGALTARLSSLVVETRQERSRSRGRALAAVCGTAGILAALGATGGTGYAASTVGRAVEAVRAAGTPSEELVVRGLSSGSDQYRPGYGWGDPNHNHTGPPGLGRRDGGPPVLPARPSREGLAAYVSTRVSFSEQAHLYIGVVDARGRPLLLTQHSRRGGSVVGDGVRGPQTKFIRYSLRVPRTVPISLRVPSNLLRPGATYRIRIVAFDPEGNRSQLFIPFRQPAP